MGREIRRVPLDFAHPLYEVWPGFLTPDRFNEDQCPACDGTGYSDRARHLQDLWYGKAPFQPWMTGSEPLTSATPEVRALAERNAQHAPGYYGTDEAAIVREADRLARLWNGQWGHHLEQADVDALMAADRLRDFTHDWSRDAGWVRKEPAPAVTAAEVNRWTLTCFPGADPYPVIQAKCEREGVSDTCDRCAGHGSTEAYPGQRAEAEVWESAEPPTGEGWQEWETTSEGSPISPVFATAEELATWISNPGRTDRYAEDWQPYPTALIFVQAGWAPTLVYTPRTGLVSGAEFVGMSDE